MLVVTNPWGSVVGYGYDKTGRVTGITGSGQLSAPSYAGSLTYRAFGGIKGISYGNGKTLSTAYDYPFAADDLGRLEVT